MPMPIGGTRKMKPTQLKVATGSDLKHPERMNKAEPKNVTRGIPPAPPYLSEGEKDAWRKFGAVLDGAFHVLTKEDFAAFESLCCSYDEVRRLRDSLRKAEEVLCEEPKFNKAGDPVGVILKARPEWALLNQADSRLMQWLGRFGLTPGDRGRVTDLDVGVAGGGKANPDREFGAA